MFGDFRAVDDLSLDIARGEVFALLGPSGCGKSTTLRQIAGLEQPDAGRIALGNVDLFDAANGTFLPPQKRRMGMVFQSYAIWPHLSVFENIAYPLRLRRTRSAQLRADVLRVIRQVGLEGFEDRQATLLSGGQQQRVALARALVYKPEVLLLDEPFSNLDVKLREQMRVELKLLQREVGVTVILVTHDQSEALSLADRIGVMNRGRVEQVGSPIELYETPATAFVRDFIGQINHIPAVVADAAAGEIAISNGNGIHRTLRGRMMLPPPAQGSPCVACIRPESILVGQTSEPTTGNRIEARIVALLFAGEHYECILDLHGTKIQAIAPRSEPLHEGDLVPLQFPEASLTLWQS
jgi:ABC-type Fe3+/spermidine/putrescine transport system ATPase subunit